MKINIEGVKVTAALAESITARTLKKHIKALDKKATDMYYAGFGSDNSESYCSVVDSMMNLEEVVIYLKNVKK